MLHVDMQALQNFGEEEKVFPVNATGISRRGDPFQKGQLKNVFEELLGFERG